MFVKRDLDFSDLYPDPVKEALYELKHPNKRPRRDKIPLWETLPVFFRNAAEPIRVWLQNPDVIEICVNRPGEVWVEALGKPAMERFEVPELTETAVRRLAEHVASITQQSVNSSTPLLSAAMPHGETISGRACAGGAFWRRVLDPQAGRSPISASMTMREWAPSRA